MTHFLYILYSKTSIKYYEGETHNIEERICKHNQHAYSNSFSKIANDWELVLSYECDDRDNALYFERFIKKNEKQTIY
jgi:putative endonuclease